jgi:hypothetical protein
LSLNDLLLQFRRCDVYLESAPQHYRDERDAAAHKREADKNPFDTSFGGMPGQQDGSKIEHQEAD